MKLLSKFSNNAPTANFNGLMRMVGSAVKGMAKPAMQNVDDVGKAAGATATALSPAHVQELTKLAEDAKNYRNGNWNKAFTVGTVAGVPLMAAPLVMPDANTRAVQSMRAEDKRREAMGLKPLAATPQMIAENASKAAEVLPNKAPNFSYSLDNSRIVNMTPQYVLPGELPANSLRG